MLTLTYIVAGVSHHVAVPHKAVVSVSRVADAGANKLQIRVEDPFSYEAWNYYSDEAAFVMNSSGRTIGTYRI